MSLSYASYLKIDELLELQDLKSAPAEHDEMLFIIIHQTYELWFKQILHEIEYLNRQLLDNDIAKAQKSMKRILKILKVLVNQVDVLETMTPLEFNSFRDYLENASGFQSYQFRELEFILGNKNQKILDSFKETPHFELLEKRYYAKSLWDYFIIYLNQNSYEIPKYLLERDITEKVKEDFQLQKILIDIYYNSPIIAGLCELLIDLDEGIQEWRYRHVQMVSRTIGMKMGTGGSAGVDYLRSTLLKPVFPDLWKIRTEFK